jgi:GNAT superfamily N-acetyltransferase
MDLPTPALRIATPADGQRVDALMKESARAIFPAYYDAGQTASAVRFVAQVDPMLLEDGTYYVLEVAEDLVACGGWSKRGRPYMGSADAAEDDRLLDPTTEAAHVRAMFVRADWTRRGLGRRILETCEAAARREGFRRLDLVATLPGIPLYEAFGFTPTADIGDIVLTDGVRLPCLAMTKAIDVRRPLEPQRRTN